MTRAFASTASLWLLVASCGASAPRDADRPESGGEGRPREEVVQPRAEVVEPPPDAAADPATPAVYEGAGLPDCGECGRRLIGMPNWRCEDGNRGGPVCKRLADGRCGWVVVRCPAARIGADDGTPPRRDPERDAGAAAADAPAPAPAPAPVATAPQPCGALPDDRTLRTWPVVELSRPACGPRPPPAPTRVKELGDGTFIAESPRRGCFRARYGPCNHKKCLPPQTPIATPTGEVAIAELRVGMEVWTRDADGHRVVATVLATGSVQVGEDHRVVEIELADGRSVAVSAGHPDDAGRGVELLRPGMVVDGAEVVRVELRRYGGERTFDILPAGPTGVYWAGGIPLTSTLSR